MTKNELFFSTNFLSVPPTFQGQAATDTSKLKRHASTFSRSTIIQEHYLQKKYKHPSPPTTTKNKNIDIHPGEHQEVWANWQRPPADEDATSSI